MEHDPAEDLAALWTGMREELRSALPDSTFDLWLDHLDAVAVRGATLYLSAPDGIRAWVGRRYGGLLREALQARTAALRAIEIVPAQVAERLAGGVPRAPRAYGRAAETALNRDYTFERFVIGPTNRLAHGAALAVAEAPGEAYNPLFVCGPPGLGKTHLLVAIANYLAAASPQLTVRYTTAEWFTNEFVASLRSSGTECFKERYRDIDVLLIDDVQFLEGKQRTEEEFFHTFNVLYEAGSQIVLSADRMPSDLLKLADRLRDRFEWGLLAHLGPPDLATRLTILRRLAHESELAAAAPEALIEIAGRAPANVRQLEGGLTRVIAFSSLMGRAVSRELVAEVLAGSQARERSLQRPRADLIQESVATRTGVGRDLLCGPSRQPGVVRARHMAMYLCRQLTELSLPQIGAAFGGRDHSTVVNALRRVEGALQSDPELQRSIDEVTADLHNSTATLAY